MEIIESSNYQKDIEESIINKFLELIKDEYFRSRIYHSKFHSFHEGYGVIKEEFDELWDEIRKKEHDRDAMGIEAIQLGAMVVAFLSELIPDFGD